MNRKKRAALRAARKRRLAKAAGQKSQKNLTNDTEAVPKTETAVASKEVTALVLDPSKVSKAAHFEMHLFNEDSGDPHWMLTANGRPVGEIRLSDQEDPSGLAEVFVSDRYAKGILGATQQIELSELLSSVNGRPYVAAVETNSIVDDLKANLTARFESERRKAMTSLKSDMINMLNLVVEAQSKNFITENVLKDALFNNMKRAGISEDRAVAIIESAFQEKSAEYHQALFEKASHYADLSPEALAEIREQIEDMPVRTPVVENHVGGEIPVAASVPSEENNVPFTTAQKAPTPEAPGDEKSRVASVLGLSRRHRRKR